MFVFNDVPSFMEMWRKWFYPAITSSSLLLSHPVEYLPIFGKAELVFYTRTLILICYEQLRIGLISLYLCDNCCTVYWPTALLHGLRSTLYLTLHAPCTLNCVV